MFIIIIFNIIIFKLLLQFENCNNCISINIYNWCLYNGKLVFKYLDLNWLNYPSS